MIERGEPKTEYGRRARANAITRAKVRVAKTPPMVFLSITRADAEILHTILRNVGGPPWMDGGCRTTPRAASDRILKVLENDDVKYPAPTVVYTEGSVSLYPCNSDGRPHDGSGRFIVTR